MTVDLYLGERALAMAHELGMRQGRGMEFGLVFTGQPDVRSQMGKTAYAWHTEGGEVFWGETPEDAVRRCYEDWKAKEAHLQSQIARS